MFRRNTAGVMVSEYPRPIIWTRVSLRSDSARRSASTCCSDLAAGRFKGCELRIWSGTALSIRFARAS